MANIFLSEVYTTSFNPIKFSIEMGYFIPIKLESNFSCIIRVHVNLTIDSCLGLLIDTLLQQWWSAWCQVDNTNHTAGNDQHNQIFHSTYLCSKERLRLLPNFWASSQRHSYCVCSKVNRCNPCNATFGGSVVLWTPDNSQGFLEPALTWQEGSRDI